VVSRTGVRVRPAGIVVFLGTAGPPMRSAVPSSSVTFGVASADVAPETTENPTKALASSTDRRRDEGR